jgi:antitoxin component YwqK of YwqJK toxin-antitoxin module
MWPESENPFLITQKNKKGQEHGYQYRFHQNGEKSSVKRFVNGCQTDTSWWFRDDGAVQSYRPFRNCKKHGKWASFHENGDTASFGFLKDGKQEGLFKQFYESGQLKQTVMYRNDKRHGPRVEYLENGTRIDSIIYKDGEIVEEYRYFRNGKIRIEAKYHSETDMEITAYDPQGEVSGQIKEGTGTAVIWAENDDGTYREIPVTYKDGLEVFE